MNFEVIGNKDKAVAIVEEGNKKIADEIMRLHPNVKTVLEKSSKRKTKFRVRGYKIIKGEKNTEVKHKEFGCSFLLNPSKVYFSPRESTERQRIASKVKPNETILVMFSGICPLPIIITKIQPKVKEVYAIELNPDAHKYAVRNVSINKMGDKIKVIKGDVKKECPKLKMKFDRVIMPLPKESNLFLDTAIKYLKKGGILHYYSWAREDDLFSKAESDIKKEAKKGKIKVLEERKVLPYSPRTWKIVLDVTIT